jgi:hypothetical protein
MMMSRGSQKNASKEKGRLSTLSFRVYVLGKNDATKEQTGRKTDPFGRFFSRPLATCFPHFI